MGFVSACLVSSFYLPRPSLAKDPLLCAAVWLDTESQFTVAAPAEFIVDVGRWHTNLRLGIREKQDKDILSNIMGKNDKS